MNTRLLALTCTAAVLAAGGAAQAATKPAPPPKPQITDPSGDTKFASGDITSALLKVTGKKGRELTVTLNLASAPEANTPMTYTVRFKAGTCDFSLRYYLSPMLESAEYGCGGVNSETEIGEGEISGNSVIWRLPLGDLVKKGQQLKNLGAGTAPGGLVSGGVVEAAGDAATGTSWVVQ